MFFFKQSLIMFTVLTTVILLTPVTSDENLTKLQGACIDLLNDYKYLDDYPDQLQSYFEKITKAMGIKMIETHGRRLKKLNDFYCIWTNQKAYRTVKDFCENRIKSVGGDKTTNVFLEIFDDSELQKQ